MDTLLAARHRAVQLGLLNSEGRRLGHALRVTRDNTRVEWLEIPRAIINDMQGDPDIREIELLLKFVRHPESLRIFRLQDTWGNSSVPGSRLLASAVDRCVCMHNNHIEEFCVEPIFDLVPFDRMILLFQTNKSIQRLKIPLCQRDNRHINQDYFAALNAMMTLEAVEFHHVFVGNDQDIAMIVSLIQQVPIRLCSVHFSIGWSADWAETRLLPITPAVASFITASSRLANLALGCAFDETGMLCFLRALAHCNIPVSALHLDECLFAGEAEVAFYTYMREQNGISSHVIQVFKMIWTTLALPRLIAGACGSGFESVDVTHNRGFAVVG